MSKILILARSGFGKSTSIGRIPELGIKGLNPQETFLISAVNKPLPFRGSSKQYVITQPTKEDLSKGNRVVTNDAPTIAKLINRLIKSPFKNIIFDDSNYPSQDYFMKNALKGGWDTPKVIGYNMGLIFDAINNIPEDKNFIMMAHFDAYKDKGADSMVLKYKSTGNMVDEYIVPEGKFETVLFGKTKYEESTKTSIREFVTNDDGFYPAKSPIGMFDELYIPNDLGYIVDKVKEYYN